jgi:N-acetylmuramoyl-L-alanine amidase
MTCAVTTAGAGTRGRVERLSPWDAAVKARAVFEAQSEHTRAEYARVMDRFRAIYHDDPANAHAARAVGQVAELLAEQGRELDDRKSLRDAAGQWEFLAKAYPMGPLAPEALGHALELLGPAGVKDAVEAKRVRAELVERYPRSEAARESAARSAGRGKSVQLRDTGVYPLRPAASGRDDKLANKATDRDDRVVEASMARDASAEAMVTGIRHWSTPTYTRVAIDLGENGDGVQYQAARVQNPDRLFFDLHHVKLAPQLVGKSFAVTDDGFLTRIRAASAGVDVTRVVLDVHAVGEYSAFLLPNPERLIIDIHGKAGSRETGIGTRAEAAPSVRAASPTSQNRDVGHPSAAEVSSLPPMPVTDGSAGFGLPVRSAAAVQARVVVSSKPTVARPVPNTVASEDASDVAAVSQQAGKVEATRRPTSQPVSSNGGNSRPGGQRTGAGNSDREQGVGNRVATGDEEHYQPPRRKTAASAGLTAATSQRTSVPEAAAPTADGETLMRALGLKIGRIVIDAGHGGHDSGTLGAGGIEEKDVVLDVALRLGKLLHERLGAQIVYTRADDTFIPLETRTAIANKAQADLFISVHANSSPDASARGVEVYYLNFTSDPDAMNVAARENAVSTQSVHELSDLVKKIALKDKIDESRELASDVDASLYTGLARGNEGLKDRGVKKAPFVVLIGANMPSILAEISFVTNPDDAEQLERPEYRERVAESLCKGVERYAAGVNGVKPKVVERAAVR